MEGLKNELAVAGNLLEDYSEQLTKHAKHVPDTPNRLAKPNTAYLSGGFELYDDDATLDAEHPMFYLGDALDNVASRYFQVANLAQQTRDLRDEFGYKTSWVVEPAFKLSEAYKDYEDEVLALGENPKGNKKAYRAVERRLLDNLKEEAESGKLGEGLGEFREEWRFREGDGYRVNLPRWARAMKPTDRLYEAVREEERSPMPAMTPMIPNHLPDFKTPAPQDAKVRTARRSAGAFDESAEVKGSLPDGVGIRQAGYGKRYR